MMVRIGGSDVARQTERQARLIELFERRAYYSTVELCALLHTSRMSVRRDLQTLARMGVVRLVHGGAQLNPTTPLERDVMGRSAEHQREKRAIGAYAAALIRPGEAIGVDAGSTALEVVRHLRPLHGLTVVTHSLPVIVELVKQPDVTVIALGGTLHRSPLSFSAPSAEAVLSTLHLSTLILGTSGIDFVQGMSCGNLSDAETKRALIRAAERVIIVADHSKIGRKFLAKVAPLRAGQILVTDAGIAEQDRERLCALGVEVHIAGTEASDLIVVEEGGGRRV